MSQIHSRRNKETWKELDREKAGRDKTLIQDLQELDNHTCFVIAILQCLYIIIHTCK